jgi:hypothetical protein
MAGHANQQDAKTRCQMKNKPMAQVSTNIRRTGQKNLTGQKGDDPQGRGCRRKSVGRSTAFEKV